MKNFSIKKSSTKFLKWKSRNQLKSTKKVVTDNLQSVDNNKYQTLQFILTFEMFSTKMCAIV